MLHLFFREQMRFLTKILLPWDALVTVKTGDLNKMNIETNGGGEGK